MPEGGTVQIKSVALEGVKAGPEDGLEEGEFIVYPSTFTRQPDSYGDVIAKGAFLKSIEAWKESGDVMPGMYLHDPNQIIAEAIDQGEDDHGWWVKGRFDDDPHAQKIYKWLKGRRLSSLSFGYNTKASAKVKLDNGESVNELQEVDALEFSFLPKGFAANSDTSVVAVKSLADALDHEMKAGRVLAAKHIDALRKAQEAIGAVVAAAEASTNDDGKASGVPAVKAEEPEQDKDDEPSPAKSEDPPPVKAIEPPARPSVDASAWELYEKSLSLKELL